jgi:hypothetical protein
MEGDVPVQIRLHDVAIVFRDFREGAQALSVADKVCGIFEVGHAFDC